MFRNLILYAYLTAYFIRPSSWVPFLDYRILFYLGMVAILIVLYTFISRENKQDIDNLDTLLMLLVFVIILSKVMTGWIGGSIIIFLEMLPSILAYYLVVISCNSAKKLNNVLILLILLISFIAWQVKVQIETGFAVGELESMWRLASPDADGVRVYKPQAVWYGVFEDPNDLGMALVVIVPMLISRIQQVKILYMFPLFLILNAIYYTNSRGTILALVVSVSLYFILRARNLKGLMIGGILGLAIIAYGPSRVAEMGAGDESAQGRIEAWSVALTLFKSNPIFGVGAKNFNDYHYRTAHNSYLLVLSETGFLGLVLITALLGVPIYSAIRIIFTEEDIKKRSNNAALTAGFSGLCFSMAFLSRPYVLLPYLYAGLMVTYLRVHYSVKFKEIFSQIKYRYYIIAAVIQIVGYYILIRVLQYS